MTLTGKILLDGVDIYTVYGIFAVRGSYNDLLQLPDMKEDSNYSWVNEDGDDTYLVNRKIKERDISMTFLLSNNNLIDMITNQRALFEVLRADGIRVFVFTSLKATCGMVYMGCTSTEFINANKKRVKMVLKFRLKSQVFEPNDPS